MEFNLDIFEMTDIFHHRWETEAECSSLANNYNYLYSHLLFVYTIDLSEKRLKSAHNKICLYKVFNKIKIENQDNEKKECIENVLNFFSLNIDNV